MSHQLISFLKSGIRIAGYLLIFAATFYNESDTVIKLFAASSMVLVVSEVIGIVEEIGHE